MARLHKLFRISSAECSLLIKAAFTVVVIRAGLWVLPFRTLRRIQAKVTRQSASREAADLISADRIVWSVEVASRYVPRATCLTQALACQVLLARQSCPSHLTIGVAKSQQGKLEAHAWLESQGHIVIGGLQDVSRFTPLPPLDGKRP